MSKKRSKASFKEQSQVLDAAMQRSTNDLQDNRLISFGFFVLVLAAFLLRCYQIDVRPFHSDEGVNFHFVREVLRDGMYHYSHENYHGPLYFYLSAAAARILGHTVAGFRAASILIGAGLILLLLPLAQNCGRRFVLLAALFIAVSPSLVFMSRYAIHEMLFAALSLSLAIDLYRLFCLRQEDGLMSAAFSLALLVSTKETYVLTLFCLAFSILLVCGFKEPLIALKEYRKTVYISFWIFLGTIIVLHSGGFKSFQGVREFFLGVAQWIGRGTGDMGHFKPFWYYLVDVILPTEPYLAVLIVVLPVFTFLALLRSPVYISINELRARMSFPVYVSSWFLLAFVVYSSVPYKTPWLVINITLPGLILLAWCLDRMFELSTRFRRIALLLTAIVTAVSLNNLVFFNYDANAINLKKPALEKSIPYGPGNPFSYVHTAPGMLSLVEDVRQYWRVNPEAKVLIGVKTYWPLPFYFQDREANTGYMLADDVDRFSGEYDVIIADAKTNWRNPDWSSKYYRLSDVQESVTYFRRRKQSVAPQDAAK